MLGLKVMGWMERKGSALVTAELEMLAKALALNHQRTDRGRPHCKATRSADLQHKNCTDHCLQLAHCQARPRRHHSHRNQSLLRARELLSELLAEGVWPSGPVAEQAYFLEALGSRAKVLGWVE